MDRGLEGKVCMAIRGLLYYKFQLYRIVVGKGKCNQQINEKLKGWKGD